MKLYSISFIACAILLFSCNKKTPVNLNSFLNEGHLVSQIFSVDITHDTTLVTKNGIIINIPKESLESDSSNVKLEIKEALTNEEIVLAGLTTMSGKQALSSGGMIYINAASGYKVSIKKQLEVLVPTKKYNPAMQVFKGEKDENGKIDWKDPVSLPKDETINKIDTGEILFKANCANCHKVLEDFTGPALYGITDRRPKQWIYDFTRHSWAMRSGEIPKVMLLDSLKDYTTNYGQPDYYSRCLFNKWNRTQMTAFPQLSDVSLDALYSYVKTESDKHPELKQKFGPTCCDSCTQYQNAVSGLENKRSNYINDNEDFFTLDREIPIPVVIDTTHYDYKPDTTTYPKKVTPVNVKATYYTINIKAMGWYNIDILTKDESNCIPSELFVRLQGIYEVDVNVVLVIPSLKAFIEGGILDDGKQYGFDDADGKIPLPQGAQCYIVAFAQYKDKIIFGKEAFNALQKQTIDIALSETTKEAMQSQIKSLNLDDVSLDIKQSKNAKEIIDIDKKIEAAKKLKPKNCDCGIDSPEPGEDNIMTTAIVTQP